MINVKHSGNLGDCIYSLSVLYNLYKRTGEKINYYFQLDVKTDIKNHPVGDVMLNETMYQMAKPLFESQPYINAVDVYTDQAIDYNLDLFRIDCKNLSAGDIKLWYCDSYPDLTAVTSDQCLFVEPIPYNGVILNRTFRYNNPLIDYTELESYYDKIGFVGVESEYNVIKSYMPNVEHLKVKDFKELAGLIYGCELFIGNQSMAFAIAEQLKKKRVLEQYFNAPNVIPQGGTHYQFQSQQAFKKILEHINNGRNK